MKVAVCGLLAAVIFSLVGCAGTHPVNSGRLPDACLNDCRRLHIKPTPYVLTVDIAAQTVSLYHRGRFVKTMTASTSRFGIGQIEGSQCTPLGLHRIAEKIGDGAPPGTVFRDREVVGNTSQPRFAHAGITTRIMWLEGLDPGYNQGGSVDTHTRMIYIHGTSDQASLGGPASHGCIHLSDADLVAMYDLLPSGTLVWISEK